MTKAIRSTHEMLQSHDFKHLVMRRWSVSALLTFLLFVTYYGYILLIGYDKKLLMHKIGEAMTVGIPLGVATIVVSWGLTVIYVIWANRSYDPEVEKLKEQMKE